MTDHLFNKKVKIRKPQNCWGCATEFPKGSFLEKAESVDSGNFYRSYWCDICLIYADPEDMIDGFAYGELKDGNPEEWERFRLKQERNK